MFDCNVSPREIKKNENQLFESKNNVLLGDRKICHVVDTKERALKLCDLNNASKVTWNFNWHLFLLCFCLSLVYFKCSFKII